MAAHDAPHDAATAIGAAGLGRTLRALVRAFRPRHWAKNLVLLAGLVFTLGQPHPASDWLRVGGAVLVFCALASAIYLINDICDVEQDRKHPRKRLRPIAAGEVPIPLAQAVAIGLAAIGLAGSILLGTQFALMSLLYVLLTVAYSMWLKHEVIVDVMALAGFYVIRAAAGALVIDVEISPWLLVCTTLGALLLGFAKRRNELVTLDDAGSHRRILAEYSIPMLDQLIVLFSGSTLMAYMLYTFTSRTGEQRPLMMLTIPFVIYGILRFYYLMHRQGKGGDPATELIDDRPLLVCGVLWAVTCGLVMAFGG